LGFPTGWSITTHKDVCYTSTSPSAAIRTGCWQFKKTDVGVFFVLIRQEKGASAQEDLSMVIAQALYDQNASVGLCDVHLPSGWHLNARRVSVPSVPRRG
jgi:hypothetical protein